MVTSRLTAMAQTTIPQPVRAALGPQPGDKISWRIEDGQVIFSKTRRASQMIPSRPSRNGIPKWIGKPMPTSETSPIFKPGDLVKVPFPYTDRPIRQRCPALIVSCSSSARAYSVSMGFPGC